jgi:putative ABC transport system permease protein
MIESYFTIAIRQIVREKLYSVIYILGLAVGLACVIVIGLYVRHETTFDEHWRDADRIYRISADRAPTGFSARPAANVQPAGPQLEEDFPEAIEETARIWGARVRLKLDDRTFYHDGFRWADQSFFDLFDVEWLEGDSRTALETPFSVVLTESAAQKYFGDRNPLGETLLLETTWPITVTGVIRDLPSDTHLSATAIASLDSGFEVLGDSYENNWSFTNFHTYVRLRPGADIESIGAGFEEFVRRHKRPGDTIVGMTATKLTDIHLRSRQGELTPPGSVATVSTLSLLALAILLIAAVNFTNLATARAAKRAREVGIRKTLGAARAELVRQFLGEAVLLAAIAMVFAVALVELVLPSFEAYLGEQLRFDYFREPKLLIALAGVAVICGLIAGAYPALYLSAFESAAVLRGDITRGRASARFRSALVVMQFAASVTLLIGTAVIYAQMKFARELDRGFETEQIVVLFTPPTHGLAGGWEALKQTLLDHPEITEVTAGAMLPGPGPIWSVRAEGDPTRREWPARDVGYDFFATYEVDLLAGRSFSEERGTDAYMLPTNTMPRTTASFVLNELAARELGWSPEEALGKWFEIDFSSDFSRSVRGPVIGVVANTYNDSLREALRPTAYYVLPDTFVWYSNTPRFTSASLRLTGRRLAETLDFIDATWNRFMPDQPVRRTFLSDSFSALYAAEQRQMHMFAAFAALAVFVACLGLVGLASFTAEQRTKEISVRKALGGTVGDIVRLLTSEFAKLVLLANLLAWPIAYFLMQRWLAGFAYRIELGAIVFVTSGLAALAIALLTVGGIAIRAALAKPITALRYE